MEDNTSKTYVFGDGKGNGVDASTLMAMMNNGGFNGNANWLWIIFLFFLYGWNGNGMFNRNNGGLANELNNDAGRTLLMQAINGNGQAIGQLATSLNCDIDSVKSAINNLQTNMSQCCCENKMMVTTQGYENQIATLNQTNQLSNKLDANTAAITSAIADQTIQMNNQFCALKEREYQSKIDALLADKNALQNSISNANQTASIQSYISSVITPIAQEVNAIKAAQPNTVAVPYPQLTAVPSIYANSLYGLSAYNGGAWA